jgi:hypothetical protein
MKNLLLFFLVLASQFAFAQENYPIGPWRLGDTRAQVVSHAEFGPYTAVAVTGGVETTKAKFLGQPANVSFVFDASNRLDYIQVFVYEGASATKATEAALRVHDHFVKDLGGASVTGVKTNGSEAIDRAGMELLLDRVFVAVPKTAEDLKKTKGMVLAATFDLVPKSQPSDSKIVSQLVYSSRHDMFGVFVFQDRKDRSDRRAKSMFFADKL